MTKVAVKVRGSEIRVVSGFEVVSMKKSVLRVGKYEIFLFARGKGKEIEKLNDAIRETKALLKIAKNNGINENYYSLSKQLKLLREKKRELERIPDDEMEEIAVEFLHENGRLKVIYGEKIMEADDLYQELFLSANMTSLFVAIFK
jgi:hypothetical protein